MEELDDLARVTHLDRAGLLTRAADRAAWWRAAETAVQATLTQYSVPRAPSAGGWIGLRVPAELRGVGGLTRRIGALLGLPVRLLELDATAYECAGASALLDAVGRDREWPGTMQAEGNAGGPTRLEIHAHCRAADHPVQTFLYLVGLLFRFTQARDGYDAAAAKDAWTTVQHELRESDPVQLWQLATPTARNPVKQLAVRLLDRIPVFWGAGPGSELALDWAVRQLWYAERAAVGIDAYALSRMWVMARGPGYWPNTAHFVQIRVNERQNGAGQSEPEPVWGQVPRLLARRRFPCSAAPALEGPDPQAGRPQDAGELGAALRYAVRGLEMGEWLGLYSACLYQIDPAKRVPLDLLFGP